MVGNLVQRTRQARGLTQTDLGRRTGLTQNYISKLESGVVALPQRGTLEVLAGALDLPLADFYRAAGVLVPQDEREGERPLPPGVLALMQEMVRQHPELAAQFDANRGDEDFGAQVRTLARVLGFTWRGYMAEEGE